jgi:hypothetical protein
MCICRVVIIFAMLMTLHSGSGFAKPFVGSRSRILPDMQEWVRCAIEGEEFSVLLPDTPSLAFHSIGNRVFDARHGMRIYSAYADGVVYLVISENIHKVSDKFDSYVSDFVQTIPRYAGKRPAQLTFDHELQLDSFSGKQYSLKVYDGLEGIVDFYITKNHVYILVAAGRGHEDPSVRQFLDSFSLSEAARRKYPTVVLTMPTTGSLIAISNQTSGQIFSVNDVVRPAIVVSKPEPLDTEEGKRNQFVGTVAVLAVFASSGKVTDIQVVSGLKSGLVDSVVVAAGNTRFIPALKDGRFVSQHVRLEYNFNLY